MSNARRKWSFNLKFIKRNYLFYIYKEKQRYALQLYFIFINVLHEWWEKLLSAFRKTDVPFPGMAGNSVELRESLAKRTAEITRKYARGANRWGSAKRPRFRFVRQSVSCVLRARGGNPFILLDGCGRGKGNNAASNHSSARPLSEISPGLSSLLHPLTYHSFLYAPAYSHSSHSALPFTPFASFNGGTRVIAVPLNFKKKVPVGAFLSHIALATLIKRRRERERARTTTFLFLLLSECIYRKVIKLRRLTADAWIFFGKFNSISLSTLIFK